MRGRFVLVWLAFLGSAPVGATPWAEAMFAARSHDFGSVARDARAEFEFVFTNKYIQDVHVASATPSCSCTRVSIKNPYLKTYQRGTIVAKFNTRAFRGQHGATITVRFDKPYPAVALLQVKGYVRSDVVVDPAGVDLGEVERGTAVEKTVRVTRYGRSDWRIREVLSGNPHLSGAVVRVTRHWGEVTCEVKVRLSAEAPAGYVRDHILLVSNEPGRQRIPVQVDGRVLPAILVSPSPLFLGVFRPGQQVTRQLVIRGKVPFRVVSVVSKQGAIEAKLPGKGRAKPIHVIPVTFTAPDRPGKVVEVIRIKTDLGGQTVEATAMAAVRL